MKSISREFIRFIFFGGVNSLLTYAIYAFFLFFVAYAVAYTLSYVLGIFISYFLNARFVFNEKARLTKALQFPLVYLVQYLLGVALLYILVEIFSFSKLLAPILIVVFTVPITYLLSRFIIKGYLMAG